MAGRVPRLSRQPVKVHRIPATPTHFTPP
ncbi:hypothetical protein SEA_MCSHANE_91 [Mycobacterium phage Mcshane]|uniref:Uncharacterized protein n=2 Tax=Pegunavirus TaxID=1623295 RepID=M4W6K2_9CAUD|nr:gp90 [Mycobacterium phage ShiVal]AVD99945.1 hypothetical protein SEA_HIGHSTUMP_93 [Mycobacterium phage HighStump]QGZ17629.1 hypothetical protein SEA_MCSHANE_91 [Mycobacterium phage Mcshane]QNO12114.1 hypothetical protein SEA_ADRIANA_92 [Mycobacterium phage Adriana]QWY81810.1 hypothetical protein SEA_TRUE_90 [Mycobacterium phage True]QZD98379.1 hypothetical protein SEA_GIRAFFE_92 [Mycobacterium phage Giraffe]WNM65930.1 hypothetical protein SEA_DELRIVS__90 [Mycobacterium phage DelRivs]